MTEGHPHVNSEQQNLTIETNVQIEKTNQLHSDIVSLQEKVSESEKNLRSLSNVPEGSNEVAVLPKENSYKKEGWESQIAALKVELAQLRFENESLLSQLKNLKKGKANSHELVSKEKQVSKTKQSVQFKQDKEDKKNFFRSHFWKSGKAKLNQTPTTETICSDSPLKEEMVSVDAIAVDVFGKNDNIQGILSVCSSSVVFEPIDCQSDSEKSENNTKRESLVIKSNQIVNLSVDTWQIKENNLLINLGKVGMMNKETGKQLFFIGLEKPMKYVYEIIQTYDECETNLVEDIKTPNAGNEAIHTYLNSRLTQTSAVISAEDFYKLVMTMPKRFQACNWTLLYSTNVHGISIHTFYSRVAGKSPTLLLLKDTDGDCFGCYASQPWRPYSQYYGTGECFVFTTCPVFQVYHWSTNNYSFQLSTLEFLAMGGGKHFAIWIDADFVCGASGECDTFHSPPLSKHEEFTCHILEAWYPVSM
eukprot:jgi/Galph1/4916/GphlegSOOS_G3572.1